MKYIYIILTAGICQSFLFHCCHYNGLTPETNASLVQFSILTGKIFQKLDFHSNTYIISSTFNWLCKKPGLKLFILNIIFPLSPWWYCRGKKTGLITHPAELTCECNFQRINIRKKSGTARETRPPSSYGLPRSCSC